MSHARVGGTEWPSRDRDVIEISNKNNYLRGFTWLLACSRGSGYEAPSFPRQKRKGEIHGEYTEITETREARRRP